jgi:hypothetical protein
LRGGLFFISDDMVHQKPRELHIAQWSQGLPPGSTLQVFSFSK